MVNMTEFQLIMTELQPIITELQPIIIDFKLILFAFLYILVGIGITTVLVVSVVYAIRVIVKRTGLQVDKIYKIADTLLNQKIKAIEDKPLKQKPFFLSMLGITITADGVTGKIIFIALLSTIATTAGGLVVIGLEDFNPIPDNWY